MTMASLQRYVAATSSTLLRLFSYVFLRWIPGTPLPTMIFTLFAVYFVSFVNTILSTPSYEILADGIDLITKPAIDVDDHGELVVEVDEAGEPLQEIDVEETVVLAEKDPQILKTLLTGLPSPSSVLWSVVTLAINLGLLGMVTDLTWTAPLLHPVHDLSFARLGYVSDTSAKLLVREPDTRQLPVYLSYRFADSPRLRGGKSSGFDTAWKSAGSTNFLSNATDFTADFTIDRLTPDTRYQYALSNNHSGFFVTAPRIGEISQRRDAKERFTFIHTSCIKQHFPYNPFDHTLSVPGFKHLSKILSSIKPAFLMFLGDFIYVDVPHRHGSDAANYRREYRQVYASPDWPSVAKVSPASHDEKPYDLPWLHTWDDHELNDNWDANSTGIFDAALDPYTHYHVSVNPPPFLPVSPTSPRTSYYAFTQGPAAFFVLDTRTYRKPGNDSVPGTMLGPAQLIDLLSWLAHPQPSGVRWKIVISSVPFTKNWHVHAYDTWAGYLAERQRILEAMWSANGAISTSTGKPLSRSQNTGIVILSGDRHEFAATAFPPQDSSEKHWPLTSTVHEFSASPLNMFYLPIRTYRQDDASDVCLKYLPDGNSKVGAVDISGTTGSEQSVLRYRLFVDGEEAWSHVLVTPPAVEGVGGERWRDGMWS